MNRVLLVIQFKEGSKHGYPKQAYAMSRYAARTIMNDFSSGREFTDITDCHNDGSMTRYVIRSKDIDYMFSDFKYFDFRKPEAAEGDA